MVTTTIDLSVTVTEEGFTIIYFTDDPELSYEGYWSDYRSRAITEVICPDTVIRAALAYEVSSLANATELYIQPVLRPILQKDWRDIRILGVFS